MEEKSFAEELVAKVRKPYTITKQREKWTEEEHNKFLEALKLYGRAWQRIEEHIGTKTAVQIRSHAQKFFTKLEKEALTKGVSPAQVHDIEIPPPRPKKKPSYPYPRKTNINSISPSGEAVDITIPNSNSLQNTNQQDFGFKSEIDKEKIATTEKGLVQDNSEDCNSSEILNINSASTLNKGSDSSTLMDFLPALGSSNEVADNKSLLPVKDNKEEVRHWAPFGNQTNEGIQRSCTSSSINFVAEVCGGNSNHLLSSSASAKGKEDGHRKGGMQNRDSNEETPATLTGQPGPAATVSYASPTVSVVPELQHIPAIGSVQHHFPSFSPLAQCISSQDSLDSFLNISSTFSSLIISTLVQIPPVHAAASLAASLCPSAEVDGRLPSSPQGGTTPMRHMKPYPSMSSVVTATVAAATAWWAAQGISPWFPPHFASPFGPSPATIAPEAVNHAPEVDGSFHAHLKEYHLVIPSPSTKPLPISSPSDFGENAKVENSSCIELKDGIWGQKHQDHSSGSAMPSTSGRVNNTVLEKHEKVNGDVTKTYFGDCSDGEAGSHRLSSSRTMEQLRMSNSEKDQLAFYFMQPEEAQTKEEMPMEIHGSTGTIYTSNFKQGNFKASQTVFKPYKRCSVEAKEKKTREKLVKRRYVCQRKLESDNRC